MKGTLKNKIDVEFRPYRILGACNPALAYELSDAFIDIPALVPSEMKNSSDVAVELLAVFEASARKAGVFQESLTKTCFHLRGSQFAGPRSATEGSDDCPRSSRRLQLLMVRRVDRLW